MVLRIFLDVFLLGLLARDVVDLDWFTLHRIFIFLIVFNRNISQVVVEVLH